MKAILRKVVFGLIAAAVLAAATGVLVVSAAYALFALLREALGPSGAAAAVALAAAVLMGATGLVFAALAKGPKRVPAEEQDLLQRLMGMVRDRPIISVGALIGLATVAIRNPALAAIVAKAFLDPKSRPAAKKKARS
ncbi:MAG: hypothetical protein JWO72_106 [Caulobacteraceae bacterium]|nr:hypothetical protein [Caulobacteraceae bacterium]